jgi:hypothetical protein
MSLASLWKSQKEEFASKHIQAMVGLAGDGKLRDGSKASQEFCEFLKNVPSSLLARYANECLGAEKFLEASSVLQDVINEVGRRLGFEVQNGLYRGKINEIGNDGLWRSEDSSAIILEVKTTDAYTIDLDTLANYRKKLAVEQKIELEKSSILIVVGRNETDSLEAQVRGSRHAWDIRLISVDALVSLVTVKEELEDPLVVQKIRQILRPKEYTKVDEIIDLVFSASRDVREEEKLQYEIDPREEEKKSSRVDFKDACLERLQKNFGVVLVRRSAALYSTADNKFGVICLNSREYGHAQHLGYWFGFRIAQRDAIKQFEKGYVVFGCGSAEKIIAAPAKLILGWLNMLNVTENESSYFWHFHISEEKNRYLLRTKEGNESKDLTEFLLKK